MRQVFQVANRVLGVSSIRRASQVRVKPRRVSVALFVVATHVGLFRVLSEGSPFL